MLQGLQRIHNDDIAGLHVVNTGAIADISLPSKRLERVVCLENRIEVTNQQKFPAARSGVSTYEMTGALHLGRQVDPFGFEAESIELGPHDDADFFNTLYVERTAADIHGFFKQRDRIFPVGVNPADHSLLVVIQCRGCIDHPEQK